MYHLHDVYGPVRVEVECEINKLLDVLKEQHQLSNVYFEDVSDVALRLESGDFFCLKYECDLERLVLFFKIELPVPLTDKELGELAELSCYSGINLNGELLSVEDNELVYYKIMSSKDICSGLLEVVFIALLKGYMSLNACLDRR
ncbi:hypothetical protein EC849_102568 [Pseudomonas putida]|uniref:hypothetical protein n=1 Tax=Pseudomonas putida TaxID=303 RepID=UPI001051DE99|nr:hypothetical protein [Pseudomonas putida]TCP78722.1 hypothetical protein EC849_102568 [Pseudomonas putida]